MTSYWIQNIYIVGINHSYVQFQTIYFGDVLVKFNIYTVLSIHK